MFELTDRLDPTETIRRCRFRIAQHVAYALLTAGIGGLIWAALDYDEFALGLLLTALFVRLWMSAEYLILALTLRARARHALGKRSGPAWLRNGKMTSAVTGAYDASPMIATAFIASSSYDSAGGQFDSRGFDACNVGDSGSWSDSSSCSDGGGGGD